MIKGLAGAAAVTNQAELRRECVAYARAYVASGSKPDPDDCGAVRPVLRPRVAARQ